MTILKETAQIKKENLVHDTYVIAEGDLTSQIITSDQFENLMVYIKTELNFKGDLTLSVVERVLVDTVLTDLK